MAEQPDVHVTSEFLDLSTMERGDFTESLAVWNSGRASRESNWQTSKMTELPASLIPSATVVDVINNGEDFRFRYWGRRLTDWFGDDDTGGLLSAHPEAFTEATFLQLRQVVRTDAPLYCVSTVCRANRAPVEKFNLRLPLVNGQGQVGAVLTVSHIGAKLASGTDQDTLPWKG